MKGNKKQFTNKFIGSTILSADDVYAASRCIASVCSPINE